VFSDRARGGFLMVFTYEQSDNFHVFNAIPLAKGHRIDPDEIRQVVAFCQRNLGGPRPNTWTYRVDRRQQLEVQDGEFVLAQDCPELYRFQLIIFDDRFACEFKGEWMPAEVAAGDC
jgi:hypothetical protein